MAYAASALTPMMQSELANMRAIADACQANYKKYKPPRHRVNNLLTGYYTIDHAELEYMNLAYRMFYYRKHCTVFYRLKTYNTTKYNRDIGNAVGVFVSDQYIIKYDNYTDLRQLAAYKKLGFGINRGIATTTTTPTITTTPTTRNQNDHAAGADNIGVPTDTATKYYANIITPIWYCIYERNDIVHDHDDVVDVDDDDIAFDHGCSKRDSGSGSGHGDNDDKGDKCECSNTKNPTPELIDCIRAIHDNAATINGGSESKKYLESCMTLEIQPKLHNSVPFHNWYSRSRISNHDHDYIVSKMMLSIAKSIQFCHSKNIVHGDIKPDKFIVECSAYQAAQAQTKPARESTAIIVRRDNIPSIFLIDFGLCGNDNTDTGTGGTRPFCAPETTNINNFSHRAYDTEDDDDDDVHSCVSSEEAYAWCKLSKAHDVWSFGLLLFTIISYHSIFHYYNQYPKNVFDKRGYVRDEVLTGDPEISEHPLYTVFMKTLCPADERAPIDEVIRLMNIALTNL